ncbi:MAG: hypothetical protein ACLU38_01745 [Dysosmobacter sp.]
MRLTQVAHRRNGSLLVQISSRCRQRRLWQRPSGVVVNIAGGSTLLERMTGLPTWIGNALFHHWRWRW